MKKLNIITNIIVILTCVFLISQDIKITEKIDFVRIIHTQQERLIISNFYKKSANYSTLKINKKTGWIMLVIHFQNGTATAFCPAETGKKENLGLKSIYDFWVDEYYDYTNTMEE